MSTVFVESVVADTVHPHPNADRLEVVTIRGTTVVVQKGHWKPGDLGVYFPPDILIPEALGLVLGVKQYLKHAVFNDGEPKTQCRVGACRLRGVPSFGFVVPFADAIKTQFALANGPYQQPVEVVPCPVGTDLNVNFGAKKYEPPVKVTQGDLYPELAVFHRYTEIEHYWRHTDVISVGEPVRITEKIHGTNSRVGVINVDGEFRFMAGSHKTVRKEFDVQGRKSAYWKPLEDAAVLELLNHLCDGKHNVVVFGEIFGSGVQDMDYGVLNREGYRVFDISVDGVYLDWEQLVVNCLNFGVQTVPVLYTGPFSKEVMELTYGPTTLNTPDKIKSGFKDREGIVITPLTERWNAVVGRVCLKSVSADYLGRKGGTDEE